jgi:lipoteichoic acid synthase
MTSPLRRGGLRTLAALHGRLLFLAGLAAAYWLGLFGFALPDGEGAGRTLVRMAGNIVELWFIGLLLAGCMRMAARGRARPAWLALCWAIAGLACAGYLVQAYSLHISGNFLTALALQNGDSAQFLFSKRLMLAVALALLWWLAFCWSTLLPRPAQAPRPLNGEWLRRGAYAGSLGIAMLLVAYLATLQRKAPALERSRRTTHRRPPPTRLPGRSRWTSRRASPGRRSTRSSRSRRTRSTASGWRARPTRHRGGRT